MGEKFYLIVDGRGEIRDRDENFVCLFHVAGASYDFFM